MRFTIITLAIIFIVGNSHAGIPPTPLPSWERFDDSTIVFVNGNDTLKWLIATDVVRTTLQLKNSDTVFIDAKHVKFDSLFCKSIKGPAGLTTVLDSLHANASIGVTGNVWASGLVKATDSLVTPGLLSADSVGPVKHTDGTIDWEDMTDLDRLRDTINATPRTYAFTIIDPNTAWEVDSLICFEIKTAEPITITRILVTCDIDPTIEPTMALRETNNFIGRGTPGTIDIITTTNGTTDILSGFDDATIAINRALYLDMMTQPEAALKSITIKITYTVD